MENDIIKYWIEDDILYSAYKMPVDITLENAKAVIELRHAISNNEKQYWCQDITNLKSFTKEGRDYADIHGQDFLYATAVIVNSHITMFIFNIFIKIKTPRIPFQAFKTKAAAVKWLKELKNKKKD
jgi:hypothetical protein